MHVARLAAVAVLLGGLAFVAFLLVVYWLSGKSAVPQQTALAIGQAMVWAAGVVALLGAALLAKRLLFDARVERLDEGGIRWRRGAAAGYEPFAALADARVVGSFGSTTLVVTRRDGSTMRFARADASQLGRILQHLQPKGADAPREAVWLARGGSTLDEWLARLDALASSDDAYRGCSTERLAVLAKDASLDPELRAAAVRVLARRGEAGVVQRVLSGDPPPIVAEIARRSTVANSRVRVDVPDRASEASEDASDEPRASTNRGVGSPR